MKISVSLSKFLFIGIVLVFSENAVSIGRVIAFPLKKVQSQEKIDIENLKPDEFRSLQNSLTPLQMLENRKVREAVFKIPSSDWERACQRFFYSRLDPHSREGMSGFFDALKNYQKSIYNRLSEEAGKRSHPPLSWVRRKNDTNAWVEAARGPFYAIENGDFNISLSDLHALYANHINEKLDDPHFFRFGKKHSQILVEEGFISSEEYSPIISEKITELNYTIVELVSFFQGTIGRDLERKGDDMVTVITNNFHEYQKTQGYFGIDRLALQDPEAKIYLDAMDKMFASPFYRPSGRSWELFEMSLQRSPDLLNNAGMILRLWNSGVWNCRVTVVKKFETTVLDSAKKAGLPGSSSSSVGFAIENNKDFIFNTGRSFDDKPFDGMIEEWGITVSHERLGEMYGYLEKDEFFIAINEAAKESYQVMHFIEIVLKVFRPEP